MYKIKSAFSGIFSLSLEKGCINLQPGKAFDLEMVCSRDWIKNDSILRRLLNQGHLVLIFDSEEDPIPKVDYTAHHKYTSGEPTPEPKKKKNTKPTIIDLSSIDDVDDEVVESPIEEKPVEETETTKEMSGKKYTEDTLRDMKYNDLRKIAKEEFDVKKTKKADIISEILLAQE